MTFDPGRPEDWLCVNSYNCWPRPCDEGCGPVIKTLPPIWTKDDDDDEGIVGVPLPISTDDNLGVPI